MKFGVAKPEPSTLLPGVAQERRVALIRRIVLIGGLLAPAFLVLLAFMYLPIIRGVLLSTSDASLLRPGPPASVGLANFTDALASPRFWRISVQTVVWTLFSVLGSTLLGVAGAVVVNEIARGRGLIRSLMLMPWLAPPVALAFTWRYLYRSTGPINGLLVQLGLVQHPAGYLTDASTTFVGITLPMWSVIQVGVWSGFGFILLFTLAALAGLPRAVYEAAQLDGAGPWRQFTDITLPLIAPVLEIAVLLLVLARLGSFDLPFLLTNGSPADATNVLGVYIYNKGFVTFDLGTAAALGVILLVLCAPLGLWYARRVSAVT